MKPEPVRIADMSDEQWQLLCLMLGPFTEIPEGYAFADPDEWSDIMQYFADNRELYLDKTGSPVLLDRPDFLASEFFYRLRNEQDPTGRWMDDRLTSDQIEAITYKLRR